MTLLVGFGFFLMVLGFWNVVDKQDKIIELLEKQVPKEDYVTKDMVLDRNQRWVRRPKEGPPTYSRPSDLSEPLMGEGPDG
jgi:hypothetical protein